MKNKKADVIGWIFTYGWAILAAVIFIGLLIFFGVLGNHRPQFRAWAEEWVNVSVENEVAWLRYEELNQEYRAVYENYYDNGCTHIERYGLLGEVEFCKRLFDIKQKIFEEKEKWFFEWVNNDIIIEFCTEKPVDEIEIGSLKKLWDCEDECYKINTTGKSRYKIEKEHIDCMDNCILKYEPISISTSDIDLNFLEENCECVEFDGWINWKCEGEKYYITTPSPSGKPREDCYEGKYMGDGECQKYKCRDVWVERK